MNVTVVFLVAGVTIPLLILLIPLLMLRALLARSALQRELRSPVVGFALAEPIRRAHSALELTLRAARKDLCPGLVAAPLD
jgi:hypothetical protein